MLQLARSELELLQAPLWRAEDLGKPLPPSPHANSVCLPTWAHVIGYERNEPELMQRLQTGYPRFFIHPLVDRLFAESARRFSGEDEFCHVYPSLRTAQRALESVERWTGCVGRLERWHDGGPFAVCFPRAVEKEAKKHWRHAGEGISSRHAEAILTDRAEPDGRAAKRDVRARVAGFLGVSIDSVYLFGSGMSAIYTAFRATNRLRPERGSVQFGFSYVDTLKIQQEMGYGVEFLARGDSHDVARLQELAATKPPAAIYCEFPCNPLLSSPDLHALAEIARRHRIPLVVDETLGTWVNADLLAASDVLVTSLTKYFAGAGDVMAGAAVVNPHSPLADALDAVLQSEYEDTLWGGDALRLAECSHDFPERVARINRTAEQLADFCHRHPRVAEVYYPKYRNAEHYDAYRRSGGGYGGLFSLLLRDAEANSARFFDALRVCKGPNLGTYFTLSCPFTLLAHFDELDFVESCGVNRHLVRVSVGLEEADDLIRRFDAALATLDR